jgi:uroporphyrinogen decarboxylase
MPDLVACGYDGKHSFEDAISPGLGELHRQYGPKIALLGGVDVDFLCRAPEQEIRRRVRDTIDALAPGGGYCLGSGNSIPKYVPLENYWAMLDEGLKYGR